MKAKNRDDAACDGAFVRPGHGSLRVQGEFTLTTNQHGTCGQVPGHVCDARPLGLPDQ